MPTNRVPLLLLGAAVAALCQPSVSAQDTHFKIYGGPAYVAPMGDSDVTFGAITDSVEAAQQVGWNLGFEGRFNKLLGVELDYVDANQDVDFGGLTIGEADFSPLTATLNFHIIHAKVVDWYVGPSYSYVNWGDVHLNADGTNITGSSDIGTDSAHGWGVSTGLDIGLGQHFAITGGLRYINVDLELEDAPSISVNPLVARLGAAFRF